MPNRKPVSTIMTSSPIVANTSNKFSQVLELFTEHELHHLPIVDADNKLIGILSSNDLPKVFYMLSNRPVPVTLTLDIIDKEISISDLMTTEPVTIASTGTIDDAVKIFADKKFLSLPVVDNGALIGIVTSKDVMSYLAHPPKSPEYGFNV